MAKTRSYPRLEMEPFGEHLLRTGDLDPVYVALNHSGFTDSQVRRWMVAYAAFYHCGSACWLSEHTGGDFWNAMYVAAENITSSPAGGRWPRGHERRHFRGSFATSTISNWSGLYLMPESMVDAIAAGGRDFRALVALAMEHRSVGRWLSFKIADLLDACLGQDVDQTDVWTFLYETPSASLLDAWHRRHPATRVAASDAILEMLNVLVTAFDGLPLPHKPSRPVDTLALETVACKHASHRSGHYPLWNDIDDISDGLATWASTGCDAVRAFRSAMPTRDSCFSLA